MCGSSGGSSSTQNFQPPSWTTNYGTLNAENPEGSWQAYLAQAQSLAQTPYQPYGGQTVASLNPTQWKGMDLIAQTAMNGSPDTMAARGMLTDTVNGLYLGTNPFAAPDSAIGRMANGQNVYNPWYSNQYTDAVINDNANAMTQAYRQGSAAQLDAALARQGAFGGSAYNQLVAQGEAGLAGQVGTMANQYQLQRTNAGAQDYRAGLGQQLQAGQIGAQDWQNERANMMGAAPLALQGQSADLQAGQALLSVGDMQRQYDQDLLNAGQQAYNQQLNYQNAMLDMFGNALSRASGNAAGGTSIIANNPYQASPLASMFGLGALGYGAYNIGKK